MPLSANQLAAEAAARIPAFWRKQEFHLRPADVQALLMPALVEKLVDTLAEMHHVDFGTAMMAKEMLWRKPAETLQG